MKKRLAMLEQMTSSDQADSFAWYALALEYKSADRIEESLQTFETLREKDPDYLAMYLMAGQCLIDEDRNADAVPWLEQGIELAKKKSDNKALSELQAALGQACS